MLSAAPSASSPSPDTNLYMTFPSSHIKYQINFPIRCQEPQARRTSCARMLTQSHSYLQLGKEGSGGKGREPGGFLPGTARPWLEGRKGLNPVNRWTLQQLPFLVSIWNGQWTKINLGAFSIWNFPRILSVGAVLTCLDRWIVRTQTFASSHYYLSDNYWFMILLWLQIKFLVNTFKSRANKTITGIKC